MGFFLFLVIYILSLAHIMIWTTHWYPVLMAHYELHIAVSKCWWLFYEAILTVGEDMCMRIDFYMYFVKVNPLVEGDGCVCIFAFGFPFFFNDYIFILWVQNVLHVTSQKRMCQKIILVFSCYLLLCLPRMQICLSMPSSSSCRIAPPPPTLPPNFVHKAGRKRIVYIFASF